MEPISDVGRGYSSFSCSGLLETLDEVIDDRKLPLRAAFRRQGRTSQVRQADEKLSVRADRYLIARAPQVCFVHQICERSACIDDKTMRIFWPQHHNSIAHPIPRSTLSADSVPSARETVHRRGHEVDCCSFLPLKRAERPGHFYTDRTPSLEARHVDG
jgi:hypothetical protein